MFWIYGRTKCGVVFWLLEAPVERLAAVEDSRAQGWMRVGDGGCDWCQQYLDGEVHYVEGYDFDAHDHCNCTAQPVFG